ncbi:hypothetical protein HYE69_02480 [Staphylococcus sp. GSSP0090]|nr:hypothetical protein [Staphylococcus sp. GSSP0090]
MIQEICNFTKNNINSSHLIKYNELINLDLSNYLYNEEIQTRTSFRNFKKNTRTDKTKIKNILSDLNNIKNKILNISNCVDIGFLDNKKTLSETNESPIYIFIDGEFENIPLASKFSRENLFIQSEMHDADGVVFFLWNLDKFNNILSKPNFIYREMIMISALLGQLTSIIAIHNELIGTPFAGIIQSEWESLISSHKNKRPLFAYAFTSNKGGD